MNALSILAGVINLASIIPYCLAVARKQAQPIKATWLIWAVLDTITFASMCAKGTLNGQMVGVIIGVWAVTILAFKNGLPGWRTIDKVCVVLAAIAIALWPLSGNALFAMLMSLGATLIGSLPTWSSAWEDPKRENKLAWSIGTIACLIAVAAVPKWTLADAAQPCTFLIIQLVMMYLLFVQPRLRSLLRR